MDIPKPLIVVLGLGDMGLVHAENLAKVRKIRLGLASSRAKPLQAAGNKLSADRLYNSYEQVLTDPEVEAVVISTPPPSHPELITVCARAKKHIFSEKPLGYESDAIRKCLQEVDKAGVRFMTGFQRRWDDAYVAARRKVEEGEIGPPIVLKCTTGDPEYPEKYHRGGAQHALLKDLGVHDIDLARWLTQSEVVRAYALVDALTYPTLKETGDSDVCVAVLEMQNRAKVILHLSRAFAYGYNVTSELTGRDGTLRIGDLKTVDFVEMKQRKHCEEIAWDFKDRFQVAFEKEMAAFADLVCASNAEAAELVKDSRFASGKDGLLTTVVAEALVKSSESGMPEEVIY